MPLFHCDKCHHEWECLVKDNCDWCGATTSYILEKKTPLERMLRSSWFKKGKFLPEDLRPR